MDEKADIKRFNNIFVTHRDRYIRFAYSYTYNQETAEDLVTESLMYYWENRHRLEEVKDIPLYILVTLKTNAWITFNVNEPGITSLKTYCPTKNGNYKCASPAWKHVSRRHCSAMKYKNLSTKHWPNYRKSPDIFLS